MRQLSIQITIYKSKPRSMYGLQHRALAHTEQQAMTGPKITGVKPFKLENQRFNLYKKRETRTNYIYKRPLLYIKFLTYNL